LRLWLRLSLLAALPSTTLIVLPRLCLRLGRSLRLRLRLSRTAWLLLAIPLLPCPNAAWQLPFCWRRSRIHRSRRWRLRLGSLCLRCLCRLLLALPSLTPLVLRTPLAILTAAPILLLWRNLPLRLSSVRGPSLLRHYAPLCIGHNLRLTRLRTLPCTAVAARRIRAIGIASATPERRLGKR